MYPLCVSNLPTVLGSVVNFALRFPYASTPLVPLAELIRKPGAITADPAKFDVHKLAVVPCTARRYSQSAVAVDPRPYASAASINTVIDPYHDRLLPRALPVGMHLVAFSECPLDSIAVIDHGRVLFEIVLVVPNTHELRTPA